jgi:peptide/nickel transport system permease protein
MPEPVADPAFADPVTGAVPAGAAGAVGAAGLAGPVDPLIAEEVEASPTRKLGLMGWCSVLWLVGIVAAAILAPVLPLSDPDQSFLEIVREPPIVEGHLLGGDGNGRDLLARLVYGTRTSLLISVTAVLLGLLVGGFLGLVAGYMRGKVDTVLTTLFNVLLSIPALVLLLAFVAIFASSDENASNARRVTVMIVGLAIVSIPLLGRITRASTLSWSEREFVKASAVLGARHGRIIFREVLPNVLPAMMSIALLGIGVSIVAEGSLSLLGVGVTDVPSWGNMIALGRPDLARAPHIVAVPSIAVFLTVLSLNYLGDVIRARFDVRESVL